VKLCTLLLVAGIGLAPDLRLGDWARKSRSMMQRKKAPGKEKARCGLQRLRCGLPQSTRTCHHRAAITPRGGRGAVLSAIRFRRAKASACSLNQNRPGNFTAGSSRQPVALEVVRPWFPAQNNLQGGPPAPGMQDTRTVSAGDKRGFAFGGGKSWKGCPPPRPRVLCQRREREFGGLHEEDGHAPPTPTRRFLR